MNQDACVVIIKMFDPFGIFHFGTPQTSSDKLNTGRSGRPPFLGIGDQHNNIWRERQVIPGNPGLG